jgi:hypothetical protein
MLCDEIGWRNQDDHLCGLKGQEKIGWQKDLGISMTVFRIVFRGWSGTKLTTSDVQHRAIGQENGGRVIAPVHAFGG